MHRLHTLTQEQIELIRVNRFGSGRLAIRLVARHDADRWNKVEYALSRTLT